MKKVLIVGTKSYVGVNFVRYVKERFASSESDIEIELISVRDNLWMNSIFSQYQVVLYLAGIVHQKETESMRKDYEWVNCLLPFKIAEKAKKEGVKQFIFMSTMSVYGKYTGEVDQYTVPEPRSYYGKTKLNGEIFLETLRSNDFKVTVIRPPMIYGKGCRGNYDKLSKMVLKVRAFPQVSNQRSMIYIDNLSELLYQLIVNEKDGTYMPQNEEYICTSTMVQLIGKAHGRKIYMIPVPDWLLKRLTEKSCLFQKVLGNLTYKKELSVKNSSNYCVIDFEKSIERTEGRN